MNIINLTSLILAIQKQLILQPYDLAHDVAHHYRVYEECVKIVKAENLKVDEKVLTVSAWLHDLEDREAEKTKAITKLLKKHNCYELFIEKVIKTIKEHSFDKKQTTIESRTLFDADKLEYVNPFRLLWFLQVSKDGFIDRSTCYHYKKQWQRRIYEVENLFHFEYSKNEFSKMITFAKKIMKD